MLLQPFLVLCATVTGVGLLIMALRPLDPPPIMVNYVRNSEVVEFNSSSLDVFHNSSLDNSSGLDVGGGPIEEKTCATVEEMGKDFESGVVGKETLKVRRIIEEHFVLNGSYLLCLVLDSLILSVFFFFFFYI